MPILAPGSTDLYNVSTKGSNPVPSCERAFFTAIVDEVRWLDPGLEDLWEIANDKATSEVEKEIEFRKTNPDAVIYLQLGPKF